MPYAQQIPPPGASRHHGSHHHPPSSSSSTAQIYLPESSPGDYTTDNSSEGKECSHCHATSTPLWRRDPRTHKTLCNACGLYLYQRHEARPQSLIAVDSARPAPVGDADSDAEYDGPECSNCGTRKTSTWRRDKAGAQVCNACGVYERMNGKPRPLALRNDKIRPRTKPHGR
ncbi:GATA zinc finger-domain-containing protein [Mycena galericulata]|nr:GATA zinc finger-domain-containing protein [Mycena galericulata]